jgi:hypothetical protein
MIQRNDASENFRFSQTPSHTPNGINGRNNKLKRTVSHVINPVPTKNGILIQLIHVNINTVVPTNISFGIRCGTRNIVTTGPAPCANVDVIPAPIPNGNPTQWFGANTPSALNTYSFASWNNTKLTASNPIARFSSRAENRPMSRTPTSTPSNTPGSKYNRLFHSHLRQYGYNENASPAHNNGSNIPIPSRGPNTSTHSGVLSIPNPPPNPALEMPINRTARIASHTELPWTPSKIGTALV